MPSNPGPVGSDVSYFDRFDVVNRAFAPQVGLAAGFCYGICSLEATGKVGLGLLHRSAQVSGGTTLQSADGTASSFGSGVLTQPGNEGHFQDDRLAVIPEVGVTAGAQVTSRLRLLVGYNFLYVSGVARAGSLIEGVDSRQVPQLATYNPSVHPAGPVFQFHDGGLWAQGLTAGLQFRY